MTLSLRSVIFGMVFTVLFTGVLSSQPETSLSKFGSLPSDIQGRLKHEFGSWKAQEPENLSASARKTWGGEHAPGCPGIAVGAFQNAKTPAYALLLIPTDHSDAGYRFLIFSHNVGQSYEMTVVEKSDEQGATNYFLRTVPVRKFLSEESKTKFQVQTNEAILKVYSSDQEYESDIYFWSNGRYRQEPVDF
jgi:hypothetical protein